MVSKVNSNYTAGLLGSSPIPRSSTTPSNTLVRRISTQEAGELCDKGLCYYCDEKFALGHGCERPQLFMIADFTEPNLEIEKEDSPEHDPMEWFQKFPTMALMEQVIRRLFG